MFPSLDPENAVLPDRCYRAPPRPSDAEAL